MIRNLSNRRKASYRKNKKVLKRLSKRKNKKYTSKYRRKIRKNINKSKRRKKSKRNTRRRQTGGSSANGSPTGTDRAAGQGSVGDEERKGRTLGDLSHYQRALREKYMLMLADPQLTEAEAEAESGAAQALVTELQRKTTKELMALADEGGVAKHLVDQALDVDDPKAAMIALIANPGAAAAQALTDIESLKTITKKREEERQRWRGEDKKAEKAEKFLRFESEADRARWEEAIRGKRRKADETTEQPEEAEEQQQQQAEEQPEPDGDGDVEMRITDAERKAEEEAAAAEREARVAAKLIDLRETDDEGYEALVQRKAMVPLLLRLDQANESQAADILSEELDRMPAKMKNNKQFWLEAVYLHPTLVNKVPDKLQKDPNIVAAAEEGRWRAGKDALDLARAGWERARARGAHSERMAAAAELEKALKGSGDFAATADTAGAREAVAAAAAAAAAAERRRGLDVDEVTAEGQRLAAPHGMSRDEYMEHLRGQREEKDSAAYVGVGETQQKAATQPGESVLLAI